VKYWDHQTKFDFIGAFTLTAICWLGPKMGMPVLFKVEDAASIARAWLSPTLTFLGMTSATTAFIFTVIDRPEFNVLRGRHAESQLWRIFAQTIGWLAVASMFCVFLTLLKYGSGTLAPVGTFLIFMLLLCVGKFAWVMRQIISVRINQTADQDL
jgi:hypothetical protein